MELTNGGIPAGEMVVMVAGNGVGKSRLFDQLTRVERLNLAVCYFGLYMIGMATNDGDKVDEDCAMDNAGVPLYLQQQPHRPIPQTPVIQTPCRMRNSTDSLHTPGDQPLSETLLDNL